MTTYRVTCIPGDGIGPELMAAVKTTVAATKVDIEWVDVGAGADAMAECGTPLPESVIGSIRETEVALKGPVTTPIGSGFRSASSTACACSWSRSPSCTTCFSARISTATS